MSPVEILGANLTPDRHPSIYPAINTILDTSFSSLNQEAQEIPTVVHQSGFQYAGIKWWEPIQDSVSWRPPNLVEDTEEMQQIITDQIRYWVADRFSQYKMGEIEPIVSQEIPILIAASMHIHTAFQSADSTQLSEIMRICIYETVISWVQLNVPQEQWEKYSVVSQAAAAYPMWLHSVEQ